MDTVIDNLGTLNLDLKDEKTLKYLIGRCKSVENFERLYGQISPYYSKATAKVGGAWNKFILPEIEKQIPNCKSVEDFERLDSQTPPYSEAKRKVWGAWQTFVKSEIQKTIV
ncbi:MAG: hypothetical protein KAR00_02790 [Candidatus Pacebacteria bacterium]|nr:hypothetical protein [Candidatus Paceibacterota bacterium]